VKKKNRERLEDLSEAPFVITGSSLHLKRSKQQAQLREEKAQEVIKQRKVIAFATRVENLYPLEHCQNHKL